MFFLWFPCTSLVADENFIVTEDGTRLSISEINQQNTQLTKSVLKTDFQLNGVQNSPLKVIDLGGSSASAGLSSPSSISGQLEFLKSMDIQATLNQFKRRQKEYYKFMLELEKGL